MRYLDGLHQTGKTNQAPITVPSSHTKRGWKGRQCTTFPCVLNNLRSPTPLAYKTSNYFIEVYLGH